MKVFNKDKALRQIKLKQNKNTYIKKVSIVLSCFILLIGIMYFTFAKFEQNSEEYTLINGVVKYGGSGDITLSYVVDGVSQSTPPAKGTGYKIKSVDCTNATGTWNKNEWGLDVRNITGKAKCNLEFEVSTDVTVDLYSAAEDELYYYDGLERVTLGTTDSTGKLENVILLPDDITIYSSIAKNPNNLTESYSKTIYISEDSEEIYVMPDNTLYWYGYFNLDVQHDYPSYAHGSGSKSCTEVESTNDIRFNGVGNSNGGVSKVLNFNILLHASNIVKTIVSNCSSSVSFYGSVGSTINYNNLSSTSFSETTNMNCQSPIDGLYQKELTKDGYPYVGVDTFYNSSMTVHALWYE